jgi:hypothetical protein
VLGCVLYSPRLWKLNLRFAWFYKCPQDKSFNIYSPLWVLLPLLRVCPQCSLFSCQLLFVFKEKLKHIYVHPSLSYTLFFFFFFLAEMGLELMAFTLQYAANPFWWRVFWDRVSRTICLGFLQTTILLISASWVARITGMSHKHLAIKSLLIFFLPLLATKCPLRFCFCFGVCVVCGAGDQTQDFTHIKQAYYHWTTTPFKSLKRIFNIHILKSMHWRVCSRCGTGVYLIEQTWDSRLLKFKPWFYLPKCVTLERLFDLSKPGFLFSPCKMRIIIVFTS